MRDKKPIIKLICYTDPKTPAAEAFRTLRTNIQFTGNGQYPKSLMVTSAEPGEGKTTTIANLAVVLAQTGLSLLLLDGDMRKPTMHRVFRLLNSRGLSDVLQHGMDLEEVIQSIPEIGIDVITAGPIPESPAELISTPRMRSILNQLTETYDIVLVDTPPILPVTDSQLFSTMVQGVILVIRNGKVKTTHVKKAQMLLEHVGANLLGAVFNDKKIGKDSAYYYEYTEKHKE
ncbi:CpsD/CapB family tyrosine-protein kinase [Brevibacillus fulvus]|uniref:non-specific protein-tyrosine kinase n=1 Tax=Brevibacillus fulvus TaxID=1125967 RepID=A0A938XVK1_9BACL|nr:CpsD/CapB family tyrosine-protein kinase [Brevibacillus fulvus]MBM7588894.1 capsular exopolysaccharide synthesis family protein [Brevibacillus fulvus]